MVALSHPTLRPVKSSREVIQYAQKYMDVINLKKNKMETLPVNDILDLKFPSLRLLASIEERCSAPLIDEPEVSLLLN